MANSKTCVCLMKKFLFVCFAASALLAGCDQPVEEPVVKGDAPQFSATFENAADTRVYLADDYYFRWDKGDYLSVFTQNFSHRKYETLSGDSIDTILEYVSTTSESNTTLKDAHYAIFPYNDANALVGGQLIANIPYEQTFSSAHPNLNGAVMVAKIPSDESKFFFKNSCALLKLNITKTDAYIAKLKSITVTSKSHKLSGPVTVNIDNDEFTAVIDANATGTSNTVTLTGCEEAGVLSAVARTFFIAIPAGTYEANDLTVTFDCDMDELDCSKAIPAAYTIGRSKYLELSTTIGGSDEWFKGDGPTTEIDSDVTLTNKAIIAHVSNLDKQGFTEQHLVETVFDVTEGARTITGENLLEKNQAHIANDGRPTMSFVTTAENVFVMNTFTTLNSGLQDILPPTFTLKNLRITGELRTNTMGIYVRNGMTHTSGAHQGAFHTVWENVDVVDCKIIPYAVTDAIEIGAAVCVYGEGEMYDCNVTGTVQSQFAKDNPKYADVPLYDVGIPNNSKLYLNNSTVGTIYGWEQASLYLDNGSHVEYVLWKTLGHNSLWDMEHASRYTNDLKVFNSTIDVLNLYGYPKYTEAGGSLPMVVTINKGAHIKELIVGQYVSNFSRFIIEAGATIDKVVFMGEEMTLEKFVTDNSIKTTLE